MFELFLFALFVGGIILCVVSRTFRKIVAGCFIVLAFVVLGYFLNAEGKKNQVHANQLEFMNLELSWNNGSYVLTGRIRNNSSFAVKSIKLKFDARDCNEQGHCDTVGEAEQTVYPSIPAGQVRDVKEDVDFPYGMRILGRFEWNYSITEIDAQ